MKTGQKSGIHILTFFGGFALCLASIALAFSAYIPSLLSAWNTEEYSHGYIIPIISFLIGWSCLAEHKPNTERPALSGFIVILAGFLFLIIAQLSAFEPLAHYGLWLAIFGIFLSFFGFAFMRTTFAAFVYLLFCIPLPRLIEVGLSSELQLISSNLGVLFLNVWGVSVFQEGNIIDLGHHKLQVVEACSGLRYLFPLMSFSFLIAYLLDDALWKRVLILLSAVPITILMNSIRIAWIGILVNGYGEEVTEGTLHDLQGWSIFVLCIIALFIEVWILSFIGKRGKGLRIDYLTPVPSRVISGSLTFKAASALAVLLCVSMSAFHMSGLIQNREEYIPARASFTDFPENIAQWTGRKEFLDSKILGTLKLTDYVTGHYSKPDMDVPVNLYLAYYEKQGIGVSLHSPANCIPGSGWEVAENDVVPLDIGNMTIQVTRLRIAKGTDSMIVYYWFSQRGRIISDQYGAKFYLLVDSILKNRSDGALIRLTAPVEQAYGVEHTDKKIQEFAKDASAIINRYIPQ